MSDGAIHDTVSVVALATCVVVSLATCDRSAFPVLGVATANVYVDAARLAIEDDVAEGGRAVADTLLIAEGTNRSAPAILSAGRFAGTEGLVAVVGHSNSAASLAASQIYNEHEIVQVAPNSSAVVYSRAGRYSFRLVPPDDRQGTFLAKRLHDMLPEGGRVGVFYVNDDYGRGLRSTLLDALDGSTIDVVLQVPHLEEAVTGDDIAHAAEALAAAGLDAFVWLARGTVLHEYLPGIREAVGSIPILGGDATGTGRQRTNADGRWDGVAYVDFVDLDASPELRAFARRYQDRYGRDATGADALTYDAVRMVLAGVRGGARTGPELREFLLALGRETAPYTGITGSISFDGLGDVDRSYVLLQVFPAGLP